MSTELGGLDIPVASSVADSVPHKGLMSGRAIFALEMSLCVLDPPCYLVALGLWIVANIHL